MLRKWFESGLRFRTFLLLLPVLVLFCMGIAYGGVELVEQVAPEAELSSRTANYKVILQSKGMLQMAPQSFFMTPVREEFQYRVMPFALLWVGWLSIFGTKPHLAATTLLVLCTSSYFGYIHGGLGNVFIQGVVGVVLAVTLLKVGRYGSAPLKGVAAAIVLHGAYNFGIALKTQYYLTLI